MVVLAPMSFCINVALRAFKASQAPQNENVKAAERYNRIGSWQKWTEGVKAQRAESVRRQNAKQKMNIFLKSLLLCNYVIICFTACFS